jgi:hypothetical protein
MALGLAAAGYTLYELAVLGSQTHGVIKLKPKDSAEEGNSPSR